MNMKMKANRIILLVILAFVQISVSAQSTDIDLSKYPKGTRIYPGIYRDRYPGAKIIALLSPQVLDKADLVAVYNADVRLDTIPDYRDKARIYTLIGKNWQSSIDLNMWMGSFTYYYDKEPRYEFYKYLGGDDWTRHQILTWSVWKDLRNKKVINRHYLPEHHEIGIEYEEPQPVFNWTLTDSTMVIGDYECQKAECDYAGRHWNVWFTSEVPVDCGLWKFSGLPGLIVKAYDSEGFFIYTLHELRKSQPFDNIEISRDKRWTWKTMDRQKFRDYEARVRRSPMSYGNMHGSKEVIYLIAHGPYDPDTKMTLFTPENYLGIYFPMEKE